MIKGEPEALVRPMSDGSQQNPTAYDLEEDNCTTCRKFARGLPNFTPGAGFATAKV
jgi:hypothetical protein